LLKHLRQQHPKLPVIMMTEQHSESLMLWALRVRVWDIIIKPLSRQQADRELRSLKERIFSQQCWEDAYISPSPILRLPDEVRYLTEHCLGSRAVNPALSYIQLHMADKITEQQMAQLCDMTPAHFSRSFSRAYGITFQEYLQRARIDEATRLLHNPHIHLLDVGMAVGFRDQSYFCRVFKKHLGVTPGVYQEQHCKEPKPAALRHSLK
jgi:AraC-like DNA-binding protein